MATWRKCLVVLVALLALVAAAASGSESDGGGSSKGSSSSDSSGDSASSDGSKSAGDSSEVDDVKVNSCGKDEFGFAQANITVTNDSSKASDYMIEITFASKDGKTQVGTGNAFIQNLAPGQNKVEDVSALEEAGDVEMVCTVSSVDRMASA